MILFGGDRLDQLVADTWEFDPAAKKWTRHEPGVGPSPRAGHALLWLPKSKRVLLVGGYGYASSTDYVGAFYRRLPLELWLYDPAAQRWQLLRRFAPSKDTPTGPSNGVLRAAVNDAEELLVVADDGSTWTCKLDLEKVDAGLTKLHGVKPGSVERRTGPYDPAWFAKDVPAADPKKVAATLADLPANRWVRLATPKLPRPNMDWGSAVFDPTNDMILRFSGAKVATLPRATRTQLVMCKELLYTQLHDRVFQAQRPSVLAIKIVATHASSVRAAGIKHPQITPEHGCRAGW